MRTKAENKARGFGFVSFLDPMDCAKAIREMNGKYLASRYMLDVCLFFCVESYETLRVIPSEHYACSSSPTFFFVFLPVKSFTLF